MAARSGSWVSPWTSPTAKAEEERERLIAQELAARAQAEERRRLSRELHDRVAHDIALVHQSLELHQALKEHDPEVRGQARGGQEVDQEALESTRTLSTSSVAWRSAGVWNRPSPISCAT